MPTLRSVVPFAIALSLCACGGGDDDEGSDVRPINPDAGPRPDADADRPDLGRDADAGADADMPPGAALCPSSTDLGALDPSAPIQILQGSNEGDQRANLYVTGCGFGPAPEFAYAFELTGLARVRALVESAEPNGPSWAVAFARGGCEAAPAPLLCESGGEAVFVAEPGVEYLAVFEPERSARASAEVSLEFTPLLCRPGTASCEGDRLAICVQGGERTEEVVCGAGCDLDRCGGDRCEAAIEVSSFPYTFSSPAAGHTSAYDFAAITACRYPDKFDPDDPNAQPSSGIATPGPDLVFKLSGLKAGALLDVDASNEAGDRGDSAIFVLSGCENSSCALGVDLGDRIEGWPVPEDGDWIVIVDRVANFDAELAVRIDVTPP